MDMDSLLKVEDDRTIKANSEDEGIVHFTFSVDTDIDPTPKSENQKSNIELDINVDLDNRRIGVKVKKKRDNHIESSNHELSTVAIEAEEKEDGRKISGPLISCLDDSSVEEPKEKIVLCKDDLTVNDSEPFEVISVRKIGNLNEMTSKNIEMVPNSQLIKKDEKIQDNDPDSDLLRIINEYNAIFCKPNHEPVEKGKISPKSSSSDIVKTLRDTKSEKDTDGNRRDSKAYQFRRWCRISDEERGFETKPRSLSYTDPKPKRSNDAVRRRPSRSNSTTSDSKVDRIYVSPTKSILPSSSGTKKTQSELSLQKKHTVHSSDVKKSRTKSKSKDHSGRKKDQKVDDSLAIAKPMEQNNDKLKNKKMTLAPESITTYDESQDNYSETPIEDYLKPSPKSSPQSTNENSPKVVRATKPVTKAIDSPYTVTEDDINKLIEKCPQLEKILEKYSYKTPPNGVNKKQEKADSSFWLKRRQMSKTLLGGVNGKKGNDLDNIADIDNIIQDCNNNDIEYAKDILRLDKAIYDNVLYQKQRSKVYNIDQIADNMADAIHNGRRSKQNSIVSEDMNWNKLELHKELSSDNKGHANNSGKDIKAAKSKNQKDRPPIFRNNSLNNKNGTLQDYIENGKTKYEEKLSANESDEKMDMFFKSYKDEAREVNRIQKLDQLINTLWPE